MVYAQPRIRIKILSDFDLETIHLISVRQSDLIIVKKKKKKKEKKKKPCRITDFAVPADPPVILKEGEKRDKCLDFASELKKKTNMKHESDFDTNCNWCARYSHQKIDKGSGVFGNKRMSGVHPNYSIFEIGRNTAKSPGDLRRLAGT